MSEDILENRKERLTVGEAFERSSAIEAANAEVLIEVQMGTDSSRVENDLHDSVPFDSAQVDTAAYKAYLQTISAIPARQADVLIARFEAVWYAQQYAEAERLRNRIGEYRQLTYDSMPDTPQRSTVEHALAQARATVDEVTGNDREWVNNMNAAIEAEQAAYDRVVTWGTWGTIIYVVGIFLCVAAGASLVLALAWPLIAGVIIAGVGAAIADSKS